MRLEEIAVSLNTMGILSTVLETGTDGALLVLPEYGRVLGLWPHWRGENALWVNPEFIRQLQIGAKDNTWLNPGGDRMWLGPRAEFFPEGAAAPAVDPGRYAPLSEKGVFAMENTGEAHAWKSDLRVRFRIVRKIRPITAAQIPESWGTQWLRQAGYAEEATLEVSGGVPPDARLWNVTQVRAGVEMRVGHSAVPGAGKIICIDPGEGGRGQLVVKEFEKDPADASYPLVECRSSPAAAEFSCASPSAASRERRRVTWKTSLCAFSGRIEELRAAALRISR